MFLYQANRLETLGKQLSTTLGTASPSPLAAEIIVVQHHGMAQWLQLQIAANNGIAANLEFPLPARFITTMAARVMGSLPDQELFERQVLLWRIFRVLPAHTGLPGFEQLASYLQGKGQLLKRYQLAATIADLFDRYLIYRPDLISRWDQGEEQHWQAMLWRSLAGSTPHRGRILTDFLSRLDSGEPLAAELPGRCFLFGLSTLAPIYLEILTRLSRYLEIHCFHLSPCREYWGDLCSEKEQARRHGRKDRRPESDLYTTPGNPLLSSWGKVGQEFLQQLLRYDLEEFDNYHQPGSPHLLGRLQEQILDLADPTAPEEREPDPFHPDASLQFHCCHSPLREVQVLHDRLLAIFQKHPDLTAGDILVMAPDIHQYSEIIHGVFSGAPPEQAIPYFLADRPPGQETPTLHSFLELLSLLGGRCTSTEVLALLENQALLQRFELDVSDLPRLQQWIRQTTIRWGLDRDHRLECGVTDFAANSWQAGLDQLLLGYFMGESDHCFQDISPYPSLLNDEDRLLGGFSSFIQQLQEWHRSLQGSRSTGQWTALLRTLLHSFFLQSADEEGFSLLNGALLDLEEQTGRAEMTDHLDLQLLTLHLRSQLEQQPSGQVFLSGRLTFCNMVPMRAVPFQVICLLGMNESAFPRRQPPIPFDLTLQEPRAGDRERSKDDRYLFLEILLSARRLLYLSWVGRNQRSNEPIPPTVVISELQDYLDRSHPLQEPGPARQLSCEHPLQPFSRRAFSGRGPIASYAGQWRPAEQQTVAPPLLSSPLVRTGAAAPTVIELSSLVQFWRHPVRFFLEQQLGLKLRQQDHGLGDAEPFALDQLDQFLVRQELLDTTLRETTAEQRWQQLKNRGSLPQGGFGIALKEEIDQANAALSQAISPLKDQRLEPLEIDTTIACWQLKGWLHDLYPQGRCTWRSSRVKGGSLMELWIHHLALNLVRPPGLGHSSTHLGRTETMTLLPVREPAPYLLELMELFQEGRCRPLPFFPESSLAWNRAKPGKEAQAAAKVWQGGYNRPGEREEPAYGYLFPEAGTSEPGQENEQESPLLSAEFIRLSALYTPLHDHLADSDQGDRSN